MSGDAVEADTAELVSGEALSAIGCRRGLAIDARRHSCAWRVSLTATRGVRRLQTVEKNVT